MPHVTGSSMIEETSCRIIGAFTWPYEFWTTDGKRKIAHGQFESDNEAALWFANKYPSEFSAGAEMRRFD